MNEFIDGCITTIRPGSQLGEVDLSRLEPSKSSQVGFICCCQFPPAQSVLGQVDF